MINLNYHEIISSKRGKYDSLLLTNVSNPAQTHMNFTEVWDTLSNYLKELTLFKLRILSKARRNVRNRPVVWENRSVYFIVPISFEVKFFYSFPMTLISFTYVLKAWQFLNARKLNIWWFLLRTSRKNKRYRSFYIQSNLKQNIKTKPLYFILEN